MHPWRTRTRTLLLDGGRYLKVENHVIELPDGRIINDWLWLDTPDFVIVVALRNDGRFLCFRQTKYAIDGLTLAPVGGYVEKGEQPLACARRELQEETGYTADEWITLGSYTVDSNRGNGTAHLFLARQLQFVGQDGSDDLEEMQPVTLTRTELEAALRTRAVKALPWVTAFLLALNHLDGEAAAATP